MAGPERKGLERTWRMGEIIFERIYLIHLIQHVICKAAAWRTFPGGFVYPKPIWTGPLLGNFNISKPRSWLFAIRIWDGELGKQKGRQRRTGKSVKVVTWKVRWSEKLGKKFRGGSQQGWHSEIEWKRKRNFHQTRRQAASFKNRIKLDWLGMRVVKGAAWVWMGKGWQAWGGKISLRIVCKDLALEKLPVLV